MIIGGSRGPNLLDTVEMYNWKTNEQCFLRANLPRAVSEHTGAVIDGVPVFCGGYGTSNSRLKDCYKFDRAGQTWKNVR